MDDYREPLLHGEPSVEELLRDPIFELLLAYDRISLDRVRSAIAEVQAKLQISTPQDEAA